MPILRADRRPNKQNLGSGEAVGVLVALIALGGAMVLAGGAWLAAEVAGVGYGSPLVWFEAAVTGEERWNTGATIVAASEAALVLLLAAPVVWVVVRTRRARMWTDGLARFMSSRSDVAELSEATVRGDTERLGHLHCGAGLPLGYSVAYRTPLFATYEWSQVWVMGARGGKTRRVAVPEILSHGGPVIATSNKPDICDLTRGPRSELGHCWVQDPQSIAHEQPSWWWNMLTFVTTLERAAQLVDVWAASRTSADMAGADPYFEPEGKVLCADVLMAAALGGEQVTRLADWLTGRPPAPGVPDPADILRAHGYADSAKNITAMLALDQGQRDGLYGTARSFVRFLRDPRYLPWITSSGPGDTRPQLDPMTFLQSRDTLYLLSKEGEGSARAITGGLVTALYTAAEELGERTAGRLRTPVLFMLDEAANVCRWPALPDVYSHAGGRGIVLVTILQSPAQGEDAWGRVGFAKMWSNTNILGIGRGLNDERVLSDLAHLIGDRQIRDRSVTTGTRGHRSTGVSIRSERIFDVADLRALPAGRVVLLTSGVRPILLGTRDLSQYDWGWKAAASKDHYVQERQERQQQQERQQRGEQVA